MLYFLFPFNDLQVILLFYQKRKVEIVSPATPVPPVVETTQASVFPQVKHTMTSSFDYVTVSLPLKIFVCNHLSVFFILFIGGYYGYPIDLIPETSKLVEVRTGHHSYSGLFQIWGASVYRV